MSVLARLTQEKFRLPSPPAIAIRILETFKKGEPSFEEIARIISSDPALTAKILRFANSSFFGLQKKVDNLSTAVGLIGLEALKNMALSFAIVQKFRGESSGGFSFELFWKRAVTSAVAASEIARTISLTSENIFVAALLMDLGILTMHLCRPQDYQQVFDEKRAKGLSVVEAERLVFGFDHQAVGQELLQEWNLPEGIWQLVGKHHFDYSLYCKNKKLTANMILCLADLCSSVYHGSGNVQKLQTLKKILQEVLRFEESETENFIDKVGQETVEILSVFEIEPGKMKPYSQILQEANEELAKLNISYAQLLVAHKQAKERAEKLAQELLEANKKLRELAYRDGLTGLYNHRYFQEILEREIKRARRYKKPLSLLMIDIDHFKKINDTYGHLHGDEVLKRLAQIFSESIRACDYAARYGGEEFSIILPETPLNGALNVAERLRQRVKNTPIVLADQEIRVTISIGLAAYENTQREITRSQLISLADKALYQSKMAGRDRVTGVRI